MVRLGNFFFHYRNFLFPVFYVMLFIPSPHIFGDFRLPLVLGFLISLSGQLIRIMTIGLKYIIRGGRNRTVYAEDLVTEGLFTHTRNPLYVGNVLIIVGLGVMSNSVIFNLVMTPLFIFIYQAIIRAEENFLQEKFGEQFDRYRADTNRWLPKLNGLTDTLKSMEFSWPRVVIKEYTTTYIWLTGATLVVWKTLYRLPGQALMKENQTKLIITLVVLLALYLFARYLKKSHILQAD